MLNTYPCNPFPISSEQLHKGDNEELQAQINAIKDGTVIDSFGDVETALDTKADNDVIAPEFDAEAGTYEIGDKVMYEGKLYEFTSAHETAGEWDPTEVTETTVADELSSLESGLTSKTPLIQSMLMFAIPTTSDGRYFTIDFSGFTFTPEKYAIMILYSHQSATSNGVTVGMVYSGGFVFDPQANASYDATTKVLTVDCGVNAWTTPVVLIPAVAIVN